MKTHRLSLFANTDTFIWITCERGDFETCLGRTPTPDEVARAANDHWGKPIGGER